MSQGHISDWDRQLTHWIHFRNAHYLVPVIVQSFMILCAFLIVLGLVYVIILVIAIGIHHFIYDRDPKKVPDYVKNSIQFSSESENSEDEGDGDENEEGEEEKEDMSKPSNYASNQRKMANIDKFMTTIKSQKDGN